ncbi:hypothetical protein GCM10022393_30620 [Aquimarina addita]|uniref:Uncharacterized protein n=1 Tax=Aquimarina addita TaxID=870485 RepID=A0ABP6UNF4_9FLAO
MKTVQKHQKNNEINNVIHLIQNNIDCSKEIINHIDTILETKEIPASISNDLITQRNACAVNVMNFVRITKFI